MRVMPRRRRPAISPTMARAAPRWSADGVAARAIARTRRPTERLRRLALASRPRPEARNRVGARSVAGLDPPQTEDASALDLGGLGALPTPGGQARRGAALPSSAALVARL